MKSDVAQLQLMPETTRDAVLQLQTEQPATSTAAASPRGKETYSQMLLLEKKNKTNLL